MDELRGEGGRGRRRNKDGRGEEKMNEKEKAGGALSVAQSILPCTRALED